MANTYSQIYLHVVFAVAGRARLIPARHQEELNRYITGIVTNKGQKLLAVNGMPDHLHVLLNLQPDVAPSDVVRDIKANSSRFINEQRWLPGGRFEWQRGFGAFSYAASQLATVVRYIERQPQHHATRTFGEEYRALLALFGVPHDERHLFADPYADPYAEP